jgi:NTP pyrophosphatase (non-canonical NTP hydrolase)
MTIDEMLLVMTIEECAEVQQAISKILRFGIDTENPNTKITNKDKLQAELVDMMALVFLLASKHLLIMPNTETLLDRVKMIEVSLQLSEKLGRL